MPTCMHAVHSGTSVTDNLGTESSVYFVEVSAIQRLFYMHDNLSVPAKTVCCEEVSAVQGVYVLLYMFCCMPHGH